MKTIASFNAEQRIRDILVCIAESKQKDPKFRKMMLQSTIQQLMQSLKDTKDKAAKRKYTMAIALLKREIYELGMAT